MNAPFVKTAPDPQTSYMAVVGGDGKELLRVAVGSGIGGTIGENSDAQAALVVFDASNPDADLSGLEGKMVLVDGEMDRRALFGVYRANPAAVFTVSDEQAARVTERISLDTGGRDRVRNAQRRRPNSYALTAQVAEQGGPVVFEKSR